MAVTMLLMFGVFLWSSGSKKGSRGPTSQQQRLSKDLAFQTWSGAEQQMDEEEEEVPPAPPPPLYLHSIEASYLDELIFDPEADYEQVLAEARSFAVKQAEEETNVRSLRRYEVGEFTDHGLSKSKRTTSTSVQRNRTAKVYYVSPPILDSSTDDYHRKPKVKRSSSWKSLFFWRNSSSNNKWDVEHKNQKKSKKKPSKQEMKSTTSYTASNGMNYSNYSSNRPRRTSVSGPLYTDGNGWAARPWHSDWTKAKTQSGPLKLSAAISCTAQPDVAISPYVPLRCSTHSTSSYSSGPLYVIS